MCTSPTVSYVLREIRSARLSDIGSSTFIHSLCFFLLQPPVLGPNNLDRHLKTIEDFRFYISGGERVFLLGLGRQNVWMWDGVAMRSGVPNWAKPAQHNPSLKIELPRKTLLVAGMCLCARSRVACVEPENPVNALAYVYVWVLVC